MPSTDSEAEIEARFADLLDRALVLGLTADQMESLSSFEHLIGSTALIGLGQKDRTKASMGGKGRPEVSSRRWLTFGLLSAALVFTLVTGLVFQWPVGLPDLVALWAGVPVFALERQRCLLGLDSAALLLDLFRPPVDCSICRNITEVDRVEQISPVVFETKYAYSGRPVVVTDAMEDWTAMREFSFEFFKRIYSEDSPVLTMSENNCQFFPYKTDFKNLSEVFQMSEDRAKMTDGSEPWYIGWSNCDSAAANTLRTYYKRPYFLPDLAESSKTDWIFMGSPGYGAQMHVDNVLNPSWQAQVVGAKLWVLEPPPECYFECQTQVRVHVQPGEIILLDTNKWYHSTYITGSEMSITIGSEYD